MSENKKRKIIAAVVELGTKLITDIENINNVNLKAILTECEAEADNIEDKLVMTISLGYAKETPSRINMYMENIVSNYNRAEFQQNFRMSREAFDKLLHHFNTNIHLVRGGENLKISAEKQLLAVIWILATPDSYGSVAERFDLEKSTLSTIFFRIIDFLNQVANTFIKFPNRTEKTEIKNYFESRNKLKGIIGAVDGTYIPCKVPAEHKMDYTNRKLFTAVTLQAICDHKMRYIDCFIGYPSSVHDNRIFRNSIFYKTVQRNVTRFFEENEKILGDKAYPVETWCIPPFVDRGNLTESQKAFNKTHSSCRQIIERSFALLFGRFRRLRYLDMNNIVFVPSTILAACVLHNICIDYPDANEDSYISEGLEHSEKNDTVNEINTSRIISRSGVSIRNQMLEEFVRNR